MLGTASQAPTRYRNHNGYFLRWDGEGILFDPGEGTQRVIGLIARGAGTNEIVDQLILSRHTVRDHIKAIFAKVGVSSRGELVAKLFADHYEPAHNSDRALIRSE